MDIGPEFYDSSARPATVISWSAGFSYLPISISESIMSISRCIVRLKDCHDTEHSVELYAESLYEERETCL
jgi:hypothetical protein